MKRRYFTLRLDNTGTKDRLHEQLEYTSSLEREESAQSRSGSSDSSKRFLDYVLLANPGDYHPTVAERTCDKGVLLKEVEIRRKANLAVRTDE